jgi:hypothetical protein
MIREIPKDEWPMFFDVFSRQHEGWLVTLEIFGNEIGAQIQERELVLGGIVADGDKIQGNQIAIILGDRPDDHITHSISRPTEVSLEQIDESTHAVLAIKSADGVMALLRLRSPMLPEIVDGLLGIESRPPL